VKASVKSQDGAQASRSDKARGPSTDGQQGLWRGLNQAIGYGELTGLLQAKLTISEPNDPYEEEADRVADAVMRMPDPASARPDVGASRAARVSDLQRMCAECKEDLQRKASFDEGEQQSTSEIESFVGSLSGRGQPLAPSTRAFFEPRFGVDLGDVRVHSDAGADHSARSIQALAYTAGNNIVFRAGQYAPESEHGRRLLAHELTHVMQQGALASASAMPTVQRQHPPPGATGAGFREARGLLGEAGMAFAGYRAEEGWAFLTGPGGSAGHRWNEPGFDGVAFRVSGPFEIHILDNKSLASVGRVSSASALTTNLLQNLDDMIAVANDPALDQMYRMDLVRTQLRAARTAIASGASLPSDVRLVVTNFGGRSTGITARLARRGVTFRDLMGTTAPPMAPPVPQAPPHAATPPPTTTMPLPEAAAAEDVPHAEAPPVRAPTAGGSTTAPSPEAVAAARAFTSEAAEAARTDLRLLRAARILQAGTQILHFVADLQMLADFTSMATSGLAGEGFVMRDELSQARRLEHRAVEFETGYLPFSQQLGEVTASFISVVDPADAGRVVGDLGDILPQIAEYARDLPEQIDRIDEALRRVEANRRAAEAILRDPAATAAISMATMSDADIARLYGVQEDLIHIAGHLRRAREIFGRIRDAVLLDLETVQAWDDLLFRRCLRGGQCAEWPIRVPFVGSTTIRFLPPSEPATAEPTTRTGGGAPPVQRKLTPYVHRLDALGAAHVQRLVDGDVTKIAVGESWARDLNESELPEQIGILEKQLKSLKAGSNDYKRAQANLKVLKAEQTRRAAPLPEPSKPKKDEKSFGDMTLKDTGKKEPMYESRAPTGLYPWWFNGEKPQMAALYPSELDIVNLGKLGKGQYEISVEQGADKLAVVNGAQAGAKLVVKDLQMLRVRALGPSKAPGDVHIKILFTAPGAKESKEITIDDAEVHAPGRLELLHVEHAAKGKSGYQTTFSLRLFDNLGAPLPYMDVNEDFTVGKPAKGATEQWAQALKDRHKGNDVTRGNGVFTDRYTGEIDVPAAEAKDMHPTPVPPQKPLGHELAATFEHYWYAGSKTPGKGVHVSTHQGLFFADHGEYVKLKSPP
jgi:hypothetical protein